MSRYDELSKQKSINQSADLPNNFAINTTRPSQVNAPFPGF